jgi:D-psicose/D-tagatose/L-ribulose 3-epimerase
MHDTFHANIEERDPVAAFRDHAAAFRHFHVSENDRGTPGRGHMDWPGILGAARASGYDGWLTIEAFGRALPALSAATRVWRDLFPAPEQVYGEGIRLVRDLWAPPA